MLKKDDKVEWCNIDSFKNNYSTSTLGTERQCPICGSTDSRLIMELPEFQFYSDSEVLPKRFSVREHICLDCYALYLNPCYSDYGFETLFAEAGQSYGSLSSHTNNQIEWLKKHNLLNAGSRLLDVGCYDGSFLARLPAAVKKRGVDIDEAAILRGQKLHKNKDIKFYHGDFENFIYEDETPDAITMFHVLEHLPRPVEVLKRLASMSSSSTGLVVEVPILENGITNDISSFFSIQHMTHFSKQSLLN